MKSQLSLLLRELGSAPVFYDSTNEYLKNGAGHPSPIVFFDLSLDRGEANFHVIKERIPAAKIIGFRALEQIRASAAAPAKPDGVDGYFLLPPHAERAKARLRTVLREHASTATTRRSRAMPSTGGFKRPAGLLSKASSRLSSRLPDTSETPQIRYMEARSRAAQTFVQQLRKIEESTNLVVLSGREGAEFEVAARELNFQKTRDARQLILCAPDALTIDSLEALEKDAAKAQARRFCYVGKCDDLSGESAHHLMLFIQFLASLRNPHLCIILAHEHETEPFFREGVADAVKAVLPKGASLDIPDLRDRPEDIRPISLALLGTLRMAHPFLRVHGITEAAIEYLLETRDDLSHAKLVRILRNALALSQREELSVEDLKNYGEHDTSTSHLVESMADEQFFPNQEAVNL